MPIHFNCKSCGKPLFAQEKYAGRPVNCPGCQTPNIIPAAPAQSQTVPAAPTSAPPENGVYDMEKGPEPNPPAAVVSPPSQGGENGRAREEGENSAVSTSGDATKICPICAETIKAAAKKCRFCGTFLDPNLKEEEENRRRESAATGLVQLAEKSTNTWRTLGVLATGTTIGYLAITTLRALGAPNPPLLLVFFNVLLIGGLIWNTRQMRRGNYSVFLSAAVAILLCMPLDYALGLQQVELAEATNSPQFEQYQKQINEMYHLDREGAERMYMLTWVFLHSFIGLVVSIPVWIAAAKVAAFDRLRRSGVRT